MSIMSFENLQLFKPDDNCEDLQDFTYPLLIASDPLNEAHRRDCAWLTKNSDKNRHSCGRCNVEDGEGNEVFDRLKPDENDDTAPLACSWLTRNKDKEEERIGNYCFADDVCETASRVGDSCPVAFWFSTGSNVKRPCPEKPELVLPPAASGSPPSPSGKGMSKGSRYSPSKDYPTATQSASSPATSPSKDYPTATQSASSPATSPSKGCPTTNQSTSKGNLKGYTRGLRKMLRKTKYV